MARAAWVAGPGCRGRRPPQTDENHSHAIMDRAHEHGINFFDTADVYGVTPGDGVTEEIIGRWFAAGGGRRERTVLATKVYLPTGPGPNDAFLSARHIRAACEASLKRLRTEHIDLYQMHHIDRNTPWEEIWEAFTVLRQQGKVLYFGSSNFAGWHLAQAQEAAKSRHFLGLVSEQSRYNLMTRWAELEVLPAARAYGIGVIPWGPLNGGVLAGVLRKQRNGTAARGSSDRSAATLTAHLPAIEAYENLCADLGEDPAHVGLAWLLAQKGVTGPIIGPRTEAHLTGALRALNTLTPETLTTLDTLFPPPAPNGNKPSPEAYAW
ncbi:aldo/keto reductase [Streptomyces tritici]|uniref:aldo/keto reductase n=1 Tax=Streptomyces tritici TaxID=2054410 RepID=UPI003AF0250C